MTRFLFWEDPYLRACETTIASVEADTVTLRDTIFFAFAGGQESDLGTIAGRPVFKATQVGRDIRYTLPADHGLAAGQPVRVEIDWARRYRLMRLHFAAELVLELIGREVPDIEKVGAHISPEKARIDFRFDRNISGYLPAVAAAARSIIAADLPIVSAWSDESNLRRFWEIPGFARVACGGRTSSGRSRSGPCG